MKKLSLKGRDMVGSALFLLGEISMVGFSVEEDEGLAPAPPTGSTVRDPSVDGLPKYTISEISKSFKLVLPQQLISLTQLLMDNTLPCINDELNLISTNLSNDISLNTTTQNHEKRDCFSVIRAHAFVAMGKFCLRDKMKARDHVNIFLREIHVTGNNDANNSIVSTRDSGNSSVRSNALLGTIKYSSLYIYMHLSSFFVLISYIRIE